MNPKPPAAPSAPMISTRDIYYVIFRHKWLIGILAVLGVAGSVVFRQMYPIYYQSESKLLVKNIIDTKPLTAENLDASVTQMNNADGALSAEVEMLTSLDVCKEAARRVGPVNILPTGSGTNEIAAALAIQRGLVPVRDRGSGVIRVYFTSGDRDLVQPVLSAVIEAYKAEHNEVRHPTNSEALTETIDHVQGDLRDVEKKLLEERKKAGIISLEESAKAVGASIGNLENQLDTLETEMAIQEMIIEEIKKGLPAATTNNASSPTNQPAEVTPEIAKEYRKTTLLYQSLQSKELDWLSQTTTNNPEVRAIEAQIATIEAKLNKMVEKYPALVAMKQGEASPNTAPDPRVALEKAQMTFKTMAFKYQRLTNSLAFAKARQNKIVQEEGPITDLQQANDSYRATLNSYQKRKDEAELDAILEPGDIPIHVIEYPTPAAGDFVKVNKICMGILCGGLFLALGLPFLIEFYLDQSLKRPADIQNRLGVPFFISMPRLKAKSKIGALKAEKKVPLLAASAGEAPSPDASQPSSPTPSAPTNGNGHIAPWEQRHALRPFFETLRDRLMTYFEVINLTHKPKLVAVTSCGEGAGVTTTAAGLASALSETGDGNVLLVNMNVQDGEAHHFYRGKLTCGLEEALEKDKRDVACVQENLFIAKDVEFNQNLPRVLPKRFSHLVPKMRASDYDYIIFDMPPMSQISITPRLARYMDMVLLVIESEKTDRDAAKRAANLLLESKTNVGVVLNKSRDHLPRRLQQDI